MDSDSTLLRVLVMGTVATGLLPSDVNALNNGLAIVPPKGWRSWNQFGSDINQTVILAQYEALASKERTVDGIPTSLCDLGFCDAGIDDGWQACFSGPGGVGFHNETGWPNVNLTRFPDLRALTARARALGLKPGWYGSNDGCSDKSARCALQKNGSDICFAGDVAATIDYGFESVKYDSGSSERNMTHWALLYNKTGKPILLEDCHNGNPAQAAMEAGKLNCPMNLYRSSDDLHPAWHSVLLNLNSTMKFRDGLSGPGCWAYPDMLQVGVTPHIIQDPNNPYGYGHGGVRNPVGLNEIEGRTHFAAWCIVSSPLVLGFDLTNKTNMDLVWPIISNKESIAVNEAWVGDAGTLLKYSKEPRVQVPNCPHTGCPSPKCKPLPPGTPDSCHYPKWMIWKKEVAKGKVALLLINNDNGPQDIPVAWSDLPKGMLHCPPRGCTVRDIYTHKDLAPSSTGYTAKGLATHDSAFLMVTGSNVGD